MVIDYSVKYILDSIKEKLSELLAQDQLKLQGNTGISNNDKLNLLNSIVYLKSKIGQDFYVDLKELIRHYVVTLSERTSGYDRINLRVITVYLETLTIKDQYYLVQYFIRVLKQENYDDYKPVARLEECLELKYKIQFFNKQYIPRIAHLIITYNVLTILITIAVVLSLPIIIFYPVANLENPIFSINTVSYLDDGTFNNMLNAFAGYYNLDNRIEIIALNYKGLIVLVILHITHFALIFNYLINTISSKVGTVQFD